MNRFHVHLNVADLNASMRFYSEFIASQPTALKNDCARRMLKYPQGSRRESFRAAGNGSPCCAPRPDGR